MIVAAQPAEPDGQALPPVPLLFIGWRNVHGQQIAQRIDCHVHLAAPFAFVAVVTSTWTAFARRLQRARIQDIPPQYVSRALGYTGVKASVH